MTLLRAWTVADEVNLRRRVRSLIDREGTERVGVVARAPRARPPRATGGCGECADTGHRHATVRVGPFVICRCLSCPVLVVAVRS